MDTNEIQAAQQGVAQLHEAIALLVAAPLPELVGSEKQIAWATDLRAQMMPALAREIALARREALRGDITAMSLAKKEAAYARITEETSAHWWIEQRGYNDHANDLYLAVLRGRIA